MTPSLFRLSPLLIVMLCAVTEASAEPQRRVVSLGGAVTETLFALGAGSEVVAVDSTSRFPADVEDLPQVGYLRRLSAEGILSLAPDRVIASAEAGPPAVLAQLEDAGVPVGVIAHTPSVAGTLNIIHDTAAAVGREAEGEALADAFRREMAAVERWVAGFDTRPKVLFLLNARDGAPMAAGRATAADAIITLAGGENIFTGHDGYKPLAVEAAISAAPDMVLMMAHTLKALGGAEAVAEMPAIALTPAGRDGRIVAMDGTLLLGFGPRLPRAVRRLADALHGTAVAGR